MGFSIIPPIETDALFAFVLLFKQEEIHSLEFKVYNGTPSRVKELEGGVDMVQNSFQLHGKNLEQMTKALNQVDFNQIQRIQVVIQTGKRWITCSIDALNRSIDLGSMDILEYPILHAYCKKAGIEKLTITV